MPVRVAINGFGRIGRNVFRAMVESKRTDVEFVAINDLGPVESNAHLLRYDSVHGRLKEDVVVSGETMTVGKTTVKVLKERDWTAGCIAVDEDEITEVASLVRDGTIVDIEE